MVDKAASDLKDAELHHKFLTNIRVEVQAELIQATDAENSALADVQKKRKAVEEAEDFAINQRREAFKAQVRAKGLCTLADGLLPSSSFACEYNS